MMEQNNKNLNNLPKIKEPRSKIGGGLIVILLSVLLISIGVTYAYFNTVGSTKKEELSLSTGIMSLAFNDGNPEINGLHTLNLGESITKKFTIENTGTLDASLSLDFNRLYNTYMDGSLTYKLEWLNPETEEYEIVVNETNMPVSSTEMSHPISTEISVPTNKTYNYNLVITFNSTEEDQTSDMNATFYTYFNVDQPLKYRKYKLNVDLNGGSWTKTDEILPMSHKEETTLPNPTKEGYTFIGWDIKGSGSSVEEEVFKMGITDTKVTAKWEPINYIVTIDKGDGSTPITETKTIEDNKVKLPSREEMNNLKEGYEFSGWEVTGGEYSEIENTFTLTEYKNASISAIWTPRNYGYTINYRKQNISNSSEYTIFKSITDQRADYGTIPTSKIPKEVGFGTPQVKSVTIGTNEEANIINVDYPRESYNLTINPNNGTYEGKTTNTIIDNIKYEDTRTISEPIKEGYINNWELTGENSSINENTFTMGSENARLTAEWTPIASVVTLNANGGVVNDKSEDNIIVLYDSTYGELPEPTKPDYVFLGWYTEASGGNQVTENTKVSITTNQTLYAHWKLNMVDTIKNLANSGTPDFSQAATTDEGVFTMEDDYGTSYYFRGAVTNNYIKFAGFYWRIIRINGDGTLRIIYDGTSAHPNGEENEDRVAIKNVKWNNYTNDAKYVGYMYGGKEGEASTSKKQAQTNETNSNIKTVLESWYETNILNKGYVSAIADSMFCHDRSTPDSSNALGYGSNNQTAYGPYERFNTNRSTSIPTLKCNMNSTVNTENDVFTSKNANHGNKMLKYPVGLITADESIAAGEIIFKANKNLYLYKGLRYWTLSPYQFVINYNGNSGTNIAISFIISYALHYTSGTDDNVVPVINLTSEYAKSLIGDGTMENPYREDGMEP